MEINIRGWRYGDEDELARHGDDHDVWRNMRDRFPRPYSLIRAKAWIQQTMDRLKTHFAITVDDRPVGGVGWDWGYDVERVSAEVGYWLGREFWGKGVATRALELLVERAKADGRLTRLYAVPLARNAASCRVLEKAGFTLDAILRRAVVKEDEVLDQALYSLVIG